MRSSSCAWKVPATCNSYDECFLINFELPSNHVMSNAPYPSSKGHVSVGGDGMGGVKTSRALIKQFELELNFFVI